MATGGLLGVILENVLGLTHETVDGREPTSQKFMRALEKHLPQFSWRLDVLALENYKLAQSRIRVFIRGLWKGIVSQVPAPSRSFR